MKFLLAALLLCTSCVKAKNVQLVPLKHATGYSYYVDAKGLTVVILYNDAVYTDVIKDLCKTPCAIETVGEMLILEPLEGKKK